MRLAGQRVGGFFAAAPEAVAYIAGFLRAPEGKPFAIADVCAGEGAAIAQLAGLLGCPPERTFAIELDESRADKLRAALPGANVLAPASFFGCRASYSSFPFIWLNSPFDSSYGGHRVEDRFLQTATEWLCPGGVMALVCPEDVVGEWSSTRRQFSNHYEHVRIVPFPEHVRPFREVCVLAHKRKTFYTKGERDEANWESVQAAPGFVWHIPSGPGPRSFKKVEPTEDELKRMLAGSPLRARLERHEERRAPAPPLALSLGHVALLLASGYLDGVVSPDGRLPHVVRGSSRKEEYISNISETEDEKGETKTVTTISERIDLVVRTVDLSGEIRTFKADDGKAAPVVPMESEKQSKPRGKRRGRVAIAS